MRNVRRHAAVLPAFCNNTDVYKYIEKWFRAVHHRSKIMTYYIKAKEAGQFQLVFTF